MAATSMQAFCYDKYGGGAASLKKVEIPVPAPKKGEILVKVEAVSINPVDWKIQNGVMRPFLPKFPCVPQLKCGARNIDLVKSLGADEVLDYRTPEGKTLKSPSGRKYDAVVHCTVGIAWSVFEKNLSEKGKVIDLTPGFSSIVTSALKKITFSKKQLVPFLPKIGSKDLEFLVGLVKDGKLKPVIDSVHSFDEAPEAWAKSMEGHATGKIIIEVEK
ncbi:Oxidoreductase [Rhynchospora pubera]|uniref:Oxidoreductase n=1 Tax=Rhynchospora pubera TaxID=906938 RepID=A0AAV8HHN0_9POAL|nr:Oxidoreductase [Rhynchospora pubera]